MSDMIPEGMGGIGMMHGVPTTAKSKEVGKMFKAMTAASVVAPVFQNIFDTLIDGSGAMEPMNLFLERLSDETAAKTADTMSNMLDKMMSPETDAAIASISGFFAGMINAAGDMTKALTDLTGVTQEQAEGFEEYFTKMGRAIIMPWTLFEPILDRISHKMRMLEYQSENLSKGESLAALIGTEVESVLPATEGVMGKLTWGEILGGY